MSQSGAKAGGVLSGIWLVLTVLALGTCTRVALMVGSFADLGELSFVELARVVYTGARIDLVVAGQLAVPWALALLLPERWTRRVRAGYAVLAVTAVALANAADVVFFRFYGYRMNYLVLDYMADHEVWATLTRMPVVWACLGGALGIAGLWSWLSARLASRAAAPRWPPALVWSARLVFLAAALLAGRGTVDHRPLNPSFASVTSNRVANELAGLGLFTLGYEAVRRASGEAIELADLYTPLPPREARSRVERLRPPGPDRALHRVRADARRPLNVVVVVMESFTGRLVGALGGEPALSPAFDALARDGFLSTHCYATGERTVQGLEAVVASFPPLPGVSIVRRPESAGQVTTLGSVLARRGYDTLFAYGGQGIFDHMRSFFLANGFRTFIEETDFEDVAFRGSWGVSDGDLFRRANREMQARYDAGRPFLSVLLTVSLHAPWEFPAGQAPELPDDAVPPEGFERAELASFLYADHAVGEFVREARELPYFDHTLFVFVGDHGVHLRGRGLVPSEEYRVPALFYAPGHVAPGRSDEVASQIDLAPTILGLLGLPPEPDFFGRDLLATPHEPGLAVLIYRKERYAVRREDRLAVLGPDGLRAAYRVTPDGAAVPTPIATPHLNDARDGLALVQTAEQRLETSPTLLSGTPRREARRSDRLLD